MGLDTRINVAGAPLNTASKPPKILLVGLGGTGYNIPRCIFSINDEESQYEQTI